MIQLRTDYGFALFDLHYYFLSYILWIKSLQSVATNDIVVFRVRCEHCIQIIIYRKKQTNEHIKEKKKNETKRKEKEEERK